MSKPWPHAGCTGKWIVEDDVATCDQCHKQQAVYYIQGDPIVSAVVLDYRDV